MSFDEDSYDIGDAQQFYGTVAPWAQDISDEIYSNEGRNYPSLSNFEEEYYSNEGLNYPTPESTQGSGGSPINASMANYTNWDRLYNNLKNFGSKAGNFATSNQGIMALLAALAAYKDRAGPSGGGTTQGYGGPRQYNRTVDQGIVRYAANGGLMQAYAHGGAVRPFPMEDGGFVMTADAVKGANKMVDGGIASLLPDAKMIRGPGTGKSDDIPAVIHGPNGQTPARLSNGEAYVPPGRDTKGLYALMHKLERKA